jgi:hypothetical protein
MRVKHDKFLTPALHGERAVNSGDPYTVIRDFFSAAPLKYYRKTISHLLKAAYSEDYWKKSDPGSLLRFEQQMLELIAACHGLTRPEKYRTKRKNFALADESVFENGLEPSSYCGSYNHKKVWEFFPRNLTRREFLNPYKAYTGFFADKDLQFRQTEFKEMVTFALEPFGNETGIDYDYLDIHIRLQKLVEASHLIDVRVNRS